tara:strand:- start:531 stop:668 length:138 start_codon:yes stop_codon:yes gene_type:complete
LPELGEFVREDEESIAMALEVEGGAETERICASLYVSTRIVTHVE